MQLRRAKAQDTPFIVEMARLACTFEDRPLPSRDASEVLALLPTPDAAIVATDDDGRPLGAAWWQDISTRGPASGSPVPVAGGSA